MLAVENLSCGYGGKCIVRNLSFEVERGSVLVLLGPNGIGKTTLFKTVLGLLPRLGGNILLEGVPLDMRPGGADLKRIAYVPKLMCRHSRSACSMWFLWDEPLA